MSASLISSVSETRVEDPHLRNRRLREATRYVTRPWLPPSPAVLKRIQDSLKSPGTLKVSDVHADLKSDFALFSHCLRKVGSSLADKGSDQTPVAAIQAMPMEKLREILTAPAGEWTTHDMGSVKDVQLSRVRHSVISCSAVEVLAANSNLDPGLAMACSMIRELGFLLVAWNYPSSYLRARGQLEDKVQHPESFEDGLEKLLGFSPVQLGFEVAGAWCQHPLFVSVMNGGRSLKGGKSEPDSSLAEDAALLRQFLRAGEILARINDPASYPDAAKDWKIAEETLKQYLGATGVRIIRERIDQLYPHYVALSDSLFPDDLSPESAARAMNHQYSRKLLEENVFVRRCPPELKMLFVETYEGIQQNAPSASAVNTLVGRVIPTAGFVSGCVYLLDPTKMVLVPKLLIGGAREKTFKTISCSCGGLKSHPVSEAFHCTTPLKEEGAILNGDVVSHITGRFGSGDRMGVLYLEFKDQFEEILTSEDRLLYFKAIRQALSDILSLKDR